MSRGALIAALLGASAVAWAAPVERTVTLADGTPFVFVEIPAGGFRMGSPDDEAGRARDEAPMHDVMISKFFWFGKFEVTQAQWRAVTGENPSTFQDFPASASHPVEGVSWLDTQQFIVRLDARGLGRFRLPTEAEWEYAARSATAARFPWGDDPAYRELPQHAWFNPRSEGRSHPVGQKSANAWGLHDMLGGVWEWCEDWFADYAPGPATDPHGPPAGAARVIRGGSWFNEPEALRPANRHRHPPDSRQTNLGLRLVWEPPATAAGAAVIERRRDSSVPYGYRVAPATGQGPWFVPVPDFVAPAPGEHPRLLFRRADLPALRAKAATPEGRVILTRLRFLLDGAAGETMTTHFNLARSMQEPNAEPPPGTLTFGHAAGYGLLWQLTGERKFADFGRECFEQMLAGVRDRDSRYSFRAPGGALRAGPVLGWLAVGYDLCYDGWDAATRERLGRALLDYRESQPDKGGPIDLAQLARGTMPPYSNHFSMQTGGAALVLLALHREPWADQSRLDPLLGHAAHAMVRNLDEGFGDGGYFAEGDGTGSMSSQIVFLAALQAWKHAAGRDFFASPRPNARMPALKWIYQTVFRDGRPDLWPVRGGYSHNVWSRTGLSGAAYFAQGLGAVSPAERGALVWCYERFLAAADAQAGTLFDTASVYPQFTVAAFLNWPIGEPATDPYDVLPLAYSDRVAGFFCWRERWQDADDTVITVLTSPVRGYMGAPADSAFTLNSRGRHLSWGRVAEGPVRHWSMSPRGQTSTLTLADGTAFAVDLSGTSGEPVMLASTGEAEGQRLSLPSGAVVTVFFPIAPSAPAARVENDAIVVGRQRLSLAAGKFVFGSPGR